MALLITGVVLVVLVLAAYAAAGSYESLSHLAARHRVPLPQYAPIGLDGGLIGTILLSTGLTWAGHPIGWLRMAARMFAAGTVAANAAAGWPDPVAVFLRVFAPALLVIITEAVHSVLLARREDARDPIPFARWLLAPWPTFRLWRRMVLWRVNSYSRAVDMELDRLRAVRALAAKYKGQDWRKAAPDDLVWMLRRGVKMPEALAAVAELTARPKAERAVPATGSGDRKPPRKPAPEAPRKRKPEALRKPEGTSAPLPVPASAPLPPPEALPEAAAEIPAAETTDDLTAEAQALRIWMDDPSISGSKLGPMVGRTDSWGRAAVRKFKEHEAATEGAG
jgi:hypothetical protein